MKATEIVVGDVYWDGKQGLRKVVAMHGTIFVKVRYALLAAKVERMLFSKDAVSLIGRESDIALETFATWARKRFNPEEGAQQLLVLQAAKVKLSPGEEAFMQSVAAELQGVVEAGTQVSYDHTEGRAVGGLERKGMLKRLAGNEIELTDLGRAKLRGVTALDISTTGGAV